MPLNAQQILTTDDAIRLEPQQRPARLVRLTPPVADQPTVQAWAMALAAEADRRVAELETRLAYLEGLAVTDELTGALNRRGFLLEFSRAIDAARRRGPQGVLIICDLDGFKTVNDQLGHVFGDEVLRRVGALLLAGVRKMDVAARLGGDEFAVLLIGATLANAQRRSQCFARSIAKLVPRMNGWTTPLSASFGLATFDGGEDEEVVLHRADMAMYAEKRHRRDH
jgi:diguanylate cyclase (GGDEF)-like protein